MSGKRFALVMFACFIFEMYGLNIGYNMGYDMGYKAHKTEMENDG